MSGPQTRSRLAIVARISVGCGLPARHFVSFSQVIIYRGGGLGAV